MDFEGTTCCLFNNILGYVDSGSLLRSGNCSTTTPGAGPVAFRIDQQHSHVKVALPCRDPVSYGNARTMSDPVSLPPSLRKRFYEPIILLDALKYVYLKDSKLSEPDLDSGTGKSPRQTYFCFLNKLSQICDNQPQQSLGKTVSAVVVLDSGTIEYRFASNQRDEGELEAVKEYLTDILDILGRVTDDEANNRSFMCLVLSRILRKVLAFNRPRVQAYMEPLFCNDRLDFCTKSAGKDGTAEGKSNLSHSQMTPHTPVMLNCCYLLGESAAAALRRLQPALAAARNTAFSNNIECKSPASD